MKEIKIKYCIFCGTGFTPRPRPNSTILPKVCSQRCAIGYAQEKEAKKEKAERAKDTKARKVAIMTHKDWLNLLQKVFNTYIRMRDKGQPCISCDTIANVQYAAGHYFSVGAFPNVRFDEDNVHRQCNKRCNGELSGNIIEYRPRLIKKIGIERFEALEQRARNQSGKLSIPEIQEKITYYKNQIKLLK